MMKFLKVNLQKTRGNLPGKFAALFCAALCVFGYVMAAEARIEERILNAWTRSGEFSDGAGAQFVRIRATYYSAEYIEALIRSEAERNLWTQDEEDRYRYSLLRALNLDETIAFHIEFDVAGTPMYPQPFDRHLTLFAGRARLNPVDYDRRFNFRVQGVRDGMVWFPRYDASGRSFLDGVRDLHLLISGSISHATTRTGDVRFVWDISGDDPSVLGTGTAAARIEMDRLLRRTEMLRSDRGSIQEQMSALDAELAEINARIDELQRQ
jgi:hypothetical protein